MMRVGIEQLHVRPNVHRPFHVMGSRAAITVTATSAADLVAVSAIVDRAVDRLDELESRWSRFLADSDITRANRAEGRAVTVHPDTTAVVERAIEAWRQTRGRFDCSVLPALVHAGYAFSTAVASSSPGAPAPLVQHAFIGASGSLVVDRERSMLTVPHGASIDLGGIGKGFAADLVAADLVGASSIAGGHADIVGAMVEIGGDLVVRGLPPVGDRWLVGVQDPSEPGNLLTTVALADGGVATSGTTVHRWRTPGGTEAHHVIDPRTGAPSTTAVLTATVLAADAATAEAFATAAMLHGPHDAIRMLEAVGLAGVLVRDDGASLSTTTMADFAP